MMGILAPPAEVAQRRPGAMRAGLPAGGRLARRVDALRRAALGEPGLRPIPLMCGAAPCACSLRAWSAPVDGAHGIGGGIVPSKVFISTPRRVDPGCQKPLYTLLGCRLLAVRTTHRL